MTRQTRERRRRAVSGPRLAARRGGGDDPREALRIQARAAHQRAVHVGLGQDLGRVVGLHAAAVEHAHALGRLLRAVAHERADERDRLLRLLGRGDLPGADRPDRLVGDHHVGEPLVGHAPRAPPAPGGAACARSRPRSRSSSVSPTQRIGWSPASSAAGHLLLRARGRSRRSTGAARSGPSTTPRTPSSVSIGADTSPVNAPVSSWCMFCANDDHVACRRAPRRRRRAR